MNSREFRQRCKEIFEFLSDHDRAVPQRPILPATPKGYLESQLPKTAPERPQSFDKIMKDFKELILPGLVHWKHPMYFAYLPSGDSNASVLADMLASAVNGPGFSWASCPAIAELETVTLDWLGKMLGLPEPFLRADRQTGGGVIQLSAPDAALTAMIAARNAKLKDVGRANPVLDQRRRLSKFSAYCSPVSVGSIANVAELCLVQVRVVEADDNYRLRGDALEKALVDDKAKGLIPFYVFASLGSNACCSCDPLDEVGPVCEKFGVWLHVDGAYAGAACICPEFRHLLEGADFADSVCVDPSMWMLVNTACCALWVQNRKRFMEAFMIDPFYLQDSNGCSMDYRHWSLPLSRRFRSLKLWFLIRMYGVEGLQKHIRGHVRLAKLFESFVREDSRFELVNESQFGVVCFRQIGCNGLNVQLVSAVNKAGKIFLVGTDVGEKFVVRFCVCSEKAKEHDIWMAWNAIAEVADKVKEEHDAAEHQCR